MKNGLTLSHCSPIDVINNFPQILVSSIHYAPAEERSNTIHAQSLVDILHTPSSADVDLTQHRVHALVRPTDFSLNNNFHHVEWIEYARHKSSDYSAGEKLVKIF